MKIIEYFCKKQSMKTTVKFICSDTISKNDINIRLNNADIPIKNEIYTLTKCFFHVTYSIKNCKYLMHFKELNHGDLIGYDARFFKPVDNNGNIISFDEAKIQISKEENPKLIIKNGIVIVNENNENNENKLTFEQTININDYSEILKPLADDFTAIFYQTMLVWCKVIPSDNAQSDLLWELWLIKLDNKPIGVCGLYTLNGAINTKELWLGIIPEFRNIGLGVQIMKHLYQFAENVGCERILSYVDKEGKPLSFYKREGFDIIGTVGEYCDKHCLGNIDGDDFEDKDDFVIKKEMK